MVAPAPPDPAAIPLGVYVHVPFCLKKCPYCDFNSHARTGTLPEAAYRDAVLAELAERATEAGGRRVTSVFFGGGTPSLLSPRFFAAVLRELDQQLGLVPDCEITVEANPGASEAAAFAGFGAAGINRLSLGVQSLDDESLARLGRIHSAAEARTAVEKARRAGFDDLNLDLMFGLPEQSPEAARADLDALLALDPEHMALYQLTLEPGTAFWAQPPTLPDEDSRADTEEALRARLAEAGFAHYEVSNHARPGYQCRHNRGYWTFGDYLGLGAGAHAKLSGPGGIERTRAYAGPEAYMAAANEGDPIAERQTLDADEAAGEFALNAFRLREPIPLTLFTERTGLDPSALDAPRRRAEALGLLEARADDLVVTDRGRAFLDDLVALFLGGD